MFGNGRLTTLLLLAVIGFLIYYFTSNTTANEGEVNMEENNQTEEPQNNGNMAPVEEEAPIPEAPVLGETPAEPVQMENSGLVGLGSVDSGASLDRAFMGAVPPGTAVDQVDFNRNNVTEYDVKQFLPQEVNDEWFETDFTKAKYNLNDDKMINTNRYVIGVNTVGQSLKNPSYDIRGTIPNPKYTVSPWMNSTYEPDNNLKPLY